MQDALKKTPTTNFGDGPDEQLPHQVEVISVAEFLEFKS